jgi:hypothetical protein
LFPGAASDTESDETHDSRRVIPKETASPPAGTLADAATVGIFTSIVFGLDLDDGTAATAAAAAAETGAGTN